MSAPGTFVDVVDQYAQLQPLPPPLVPADCDLTNFLRMPLEVGRLLSSDTWIAAAEDPRLGHTLMSLWAESWRQVPAGSLPDVDLTLQRMSMCPTAREWQRVRQRALAGWVKCSDGRLYHPVVCQMALEAWLEKLDSRLGACEGNAKRWKVEFDRAPMDAEINSVRAMLQALNPGSPALRKRRGKPSRADMGQPPPTPADRGGTGSGGAAGSGGDQVAIAGRSHEDRNRTEQKGLPPNPPHAKAVDNFRQPIPAHIPARMPAGRWWDSRAGVEAAALALGLGQWDEAASQLGRGEHWLAFRDRVCIAAGDGPWLGQPRAAVPIGALLPPGVRH